MESHHFLIGNSTINRVFSVAMPVCQRVQAGNTIKQASYKHTYCSGGTTLYNSNLSDIFGICKDNSCEYH